MTVNIFIVFFTGLSITGKHVNNVSLVFIVQISVFSSTSEFVVLVSFVGYESKFINELFYFFET